MDFKPIGTLKSTKRTGEFVPVRSKQPPQDDISRGVLPYMKLPKAAPQPLPSPAQQTLNKYSANTFKGDELKQGIKELNQLAKQQMRDNPTGEEWKKAIELRDTLQRQTVGTAGAMGLVDALSLGHAKRSYRPEFEGSQAAQPLAYGAGNVAGKLTTYAAMAPVLKGLPVVGKAAGAIGGGIGAGIAKATGGKIAQQAAAGVASRLVADTVLDLAVDTIPETVDNISRGKSAGEVAKEAGKNLAVNIGFNMGAEAIGQAFKAIKAGKASKKMAEQAKAAIDRMDDAAKQVAAVEAGFESVDDLMKETNKVLALPETSSAPIYATDYGTATKSIDTAKRAAEIPNLTRARRELAEAEETVLNVMAKRYGKRTNFPFETMVDNVQRDLGINLNKLRNAVQEAEAFESLPQKAKQAIINAPQVNTPESATRFSKQLMQEPRLPMREPAIPKTEPWLPKASELQPATPELPKAKNLAGDMVKAVDNAAKPRLFNVGQDSPLEIPNVKELMQDADVVAADVADVAPMFKSSGIKYNKDFARNFDAAAGINKPARKWLHDTVEKPFLDAKANYAKNVEEQLNAYKSTMDKLGIKKGTKESAAVQWIGEGRRQANGEIIPYTLENLKADFPAKWQDILEADKANRQIYDNFINRINDSLKKVYPNAEQDMIENAAKLQRAVDRATKKLTEAQSELKANADPARVDELGAAAKQARDKLIEATAKRAEFAKAMETGEALRNKRLIPRKDYYHHFKEMEEGFGGIKNILNTPTEIDPRLVGISDFTKPKSKWAGFLQSRKGGAYTEDAVGGMARYIPAAEYKINIDPVIANNRSVIKGLAESTQDTRNANKFIMWMTDWTNDLAGKTNRFDRNIQDVTNRQIMQAVDWLNNRVKSNAVVGNLNSAVAQFFNIPNATAYVKNPLDWASGSKHYAKSFTEEGKEFFKQSPFLRERYLQDAIDQFDEGILKAPGKFAAWILEFGDKEAAKLIWGSAYEQGVRTGIEDAIRHADDITRRSIAGRGIGEVPLVQKAKITKLLAPFQVEVNNAFQLLKERIGEKDALGVINIFVANWLMNNVSEAITGNRVTMDPIDAVVQGVKDTADKGALERATAIAGRVGGEVLSNAPFGAQAAQLATAGDWQLADKVFGENDPTRFGTGNIGISMVGVPLLKTVFSDQNVDVVSPLANTLLPFGGKQVERTIKGLQDNAVLPRLNVSRKGVSVEKQDFPASYSASGRLRFPMEPSLPSALKSTAFGSFSTKEGKEYLASGRLPFSEKQTETVKEAYNVGISPETTVAFLNWHRLLATKKDKDGKPIPGSKREQAIQYIDKLPLTPQQKRFLFEAAGYKAK